jgi:DNA-binding NarL/FixJ family response regulator
MTSTPLRIVIADDHPVFREGLIGLLGSMEGVEVVAECADGRSAIQAAHDLEPDLVLMDLHMPGVGGIEATRAISAASANVAVLVLTMLEDDDSLFAAMQAGARGYLVKGASPEEVVRAVRSVASGEAVFGPQIADRVLGFFAAPRPLPLPELTDREREILVLMSEGLSNTRIASRLVLSPKTVRNHVSHIFTKLQVADREEALARARRAGLHA